MSATVFYAGSAELATLTMTFEVNGVPTDPSTVTLLVTDPLSAQVTYTYGGAGTITRISTGVYTLNIPCPTPGLWTYQWTGTVACSDVQDGTWWVASSPATMYCSAEQLKSRLGIEDTSDDLEVTMAVQTSARLVDRFCGRFFYQVQDSRTYRPESIYEQPIDDLVTISQLATDWDGDGVYETVWNGPGVDYALEVYRYRYNVTATGEPRPYTMIRALGALGGRYFPFVWPWTHQDRVKVTGTWGWPAIPMAVQHASLILASDLFKIKDAPFGVAGFSEYGAVRVGTNSEVYMMLQPYISGRNKVGV